MGKKKKVGKSQRPYKSGFGPTLIGSDRELTQTLSNLKTAVYSHPPSNLDKSERDKSRCAKLVASNPRGLKVIKVLQLRIST